MSENLSKTAAGLRPARIPVVASTTPAAPSSLHVALDESHVCALQLTSSTRATASAAEREVTSAIDEVWRTGTSTLTPEQLGERLTAASKSVPSLESYFERAPGGLAQRQGGRAGAPGWGALARPRSSLDVH